MFKLASATCGVIAVATVSLPASAVTFDLDWTGQTLGYQATGRFSYDESMITPDSIVRSEDIESFDISFFTPQGELLKSFSNNTETAGFNFNFDTSTGEILQTGRWDSPTGLNVGGIRTEELNLFSVGNPKSALFSDDAQSPHIHLTDWGNDFPEAPVGFTRGARPHLDIAFFTRTRAEVLADPEGGDDLGQKLVATLTTSSSKEVPEPAFIFGLGAFAVLALSQKKSI